MTNTFFSILCFLFASCLVPGVAHGYGRNVTIMALDWHVDDGWVYIDRVETHVGGNDNVLKWRFCSVNRTCAVSLLRMDTYRPLQQLLAVPASVKVEEALSLVAGIHGRTGVKHDPLMTKLCLQETTPPPELSGQDTMGGCPSGSGGFPPTPTPVSCNATDLTLDHKYLASGNLDRDTADGVITIRCDGAARIKLTLGSYNADGLSLTTGLKSRLLINGASGEVGSVVNVSGTPGTVQNVAIKSTLSAIGTVAPGQHSGSVPLIMTIL